LLESSRVASQRELEHAAYPNLPQPQNAQRRIPNIPQTPNQKTSVKQTHPFFATATSSSFNRQSFGAQTTHRLPQGYLSSLATSNWSLSQACSASARVV